MCWLCDHPGATELDHQDHLRRLIDTFGWAVQGVERDGIHPPAVGLHGRAHRALAARAGGHRHGPGPGHGRAQRRGRAPAARGEAPKPGTQARLLNGPLVEVVEVTAPWAHLNMAVEFYGQRIRGLQLVHTDKHGHWPWDQAYQGVRGGQPVLGPREPLERRRRVR